MPPNQKPLNKFNPVAVSLRHSFLFLMLCLTAGLAAPVQAQFAPAYEIAISTKDGRTLVGHSLGQDSSGYQFWMKSIRRGTRVELSDFKDIDTLGLWVPTTGKYLNHVGPNTGYGLKKGEFYYRNYMLTANFAAYGINDYFSIGAGFDLASSIGQNDHPLTYAIAPKVNIPIRKDLINLGIGGIFLKLPDYEGGFSTHNLYHATLSAGTPHRHFSSGLVMAQVEGNLRPSPVYTLSALWSVTSFFALQAELFTGAPVDGTVILPGIQLMGRWLDFNLFYPLGRLERDFFASPIPLASLSFKISR